MISKVSADTIATGWNNMMGNKGAVKLQFTIAEKRFMIICAHLHSGQDGVGKRNDDM